MQSKKRKRIHVGEIVIGEDERKVLLDVIDSGRITEGKWVRHFQDGFSDYIGTKFCNVVNSGTSALILGLQALIIDDRFPKISPGKKVVTSPVTYVATSNAIILSGLEPVYVDIDKNTFSMLPEEVEKAITEHGPENIGLILPVHLMGYPNNMDELMELADKYDLQIFEDCAQAHGSLYNGKRLGSFGLLSAFSFYVAHNIQAGEMGALLTSDPYLNNLSIKLKANGRTCICRRCTRAEGKCIMKDKGEPSEDPRFAHDLIGYNFKTTEFCAALACVMLKKAETIRKKRYHNVSTLNSLLSAFTELLQLPIENKDFSYLAYPLILRHPFPFTREDFLYRLEKAGVENRPLFGCIPLHQKAYRKYHDYYRGKLPNAEYIGRNGFYIACHQFLSDEDISFITDSFTKILNL